MMQIKIQILYWMFDLYLINKSNANKSNANKSNANKS